jgi:hypothetical protein
MPARVIVCSRATPAHAIVPLDATAPHVTLAHYAPARYVQARCVQARCVQAQHPFSVPTPSPELPEIARPLPTSASSFHFSKSFS